MEIVAQLVRASDCGSEGRGFESHHSPGKSRKKAGLFIDSSRQDKKELILLLTLYGSAVNI